jgi:nucleotide sugar dehydrogenase
MDNSYKQVEQVTVDSAQPGDLYFLSRQAIEERVSNRQSRIGFVGLGRVGLPLAATLAGKGFAVTGIDIKEDIVNAVNAGRSPYLDEAGLPELIRETTASGALSATTQIAAIEKCDMVIIAVPTLIKDEEPDIEAVKRASSEIAQHFSPGKVLVLQSTVPPHTTRNVLARAIEEKTGLRAGEDFGLAYSPERTQSPQVLRDLGAYPRIVGGVDEQSAFITSSVYSTFAPGIIDMGSLVAAEIEKVIENAYRDVNIAFANELARTCEIYGVDVHRIIEAANSQPFSHILEPGLVGGHCIPMDPYYIISDASRRGFTPPLMQAARDINESIFQHVVDMVDAGLGNSGSSTTKTPLPSPMVTVLGLSFKPDVRSFDTSHTPKLVKLLQKRGYSVTIHDPFLNGSEQLLEPARLSSNLYQSLEDADCLILSTAHQQYKQIDFARVKELMRGDLVIDIRGAFAPEKAEQKGLRYRGLGRSREVEGKLQEEA